MCNIEIHADLYTIPIMYLCVYSNIMLSMSLKFAETLLLNESLPTRMGGIELMRKNMAEKLLEVSGKITLLELMCACVHMIIVEPLTTYCRACGCEDGGVWVCVAADAWTNNA